MRLVLGIGNPGAEYDGTRHNLGFAVLDEMARGHGVPRWGKRWQAETADLVLPGGRALLIKPTTFVNQSGISAQAALAFHKLPAADLLVVVDDLHLPLGELRLRADGSAGGHNGLRDIEARIGRVYPRLRLGMGPLPPGADQVGFVLGRFAPHEREDAAALVAKAAQAALAWVEGGLEAAARFNGPLRRPPPRLRPSHPPSVAADPMAGPSPTAPG